MAPKVVEHASALDVTLVDLCIEFLPVGDAFGDCLR